MGRCSYSDDDLAEAIAASHSWRGVLRSLGLNEASAGSMRSARRRADAVGLSYAHFTGQRRWTDLELANAVGKATSWTDVATLLHLVPEGGTLTALRAHALRRGLPTAHFQSQVPRPSATLVPGRALKAGGKHLREAGSFLAAAWFALRGFGVSWPLEPCRYDLVADLGDRLLRVQVKTTASVGDKALVHISNSRRIGRALYAPGEIDAFFVLDAELNAYLIPYQDVAGYGQLQLSRYANYRVADRGNLIPDAA